MKITVKNELKTWEKACKKLNSRGFKVLNITAKRPFLGIFGQEKVEIIYVKSKVRSMQYPTNILELRTKAEHKKIN